MSTYFGKDCPAGMVQVEFVNCPPELRYSAYGWQPVRRATLDLYVDGQRFHLELGTVRDLAGVPHRGLSIVTDARLTCAPTARNAVSLWLDDPSHAATV